MKRKLLSILLVLVLALSLLPTAALATGSEKSESSEYKSYTVGGTGDGDWNLEGESTTYTLSQDVTAEDVTIPAGKTLAFSGTAKLTMTGTLTVYGTLDLTGSGNTLASPPSETATGNRTLHIQKGAKITVAKGGTLNSKGQFGDIWQQGTMNIVAGATITIDPAKTTTFVGSSNAVIVLESGVIEQTPNDEGSTSPDLNQGYLYTLGSRGTAKTNSFSVTGNDKFTIAGGSTLDITNGMTLTKGKEAEQLTVGLGATIVVDDQSTLQTAITCTNGGTIKLANNITIADGTQVSDGSILTISNPMNIDGNGKTITVAQTTDDSKKASAIKVSNNTGSVVIKYLTLDANKTALNGVIIDGGSAGLTNVEIKNFNGYGVVVKGSASATNLTAATNTGGGVNVNVGTVDSAFDLWSGTVSSVVVEKTGSESSLSSFAEIFGGYVGEAKIQNSSGNKVKTLAGASLITTGGYFKVDPSDYCITGKTGVASGNSTYPFTVGTKNTSVDTTVEVVEPKVEIDSTASSAGITKESVKNAVSKTETTNTLSQVAAGLANKSSVVGTETQAENALKSAKVTVPAGTTVTVVVEPYLDVEIKSYDAEKKTLTLDISAYYDVKATTDANSMVESGSGQNTVTLKSKQTLTVTEPIKITVPLPTDFTTASTVWVKHIKGSRTYYHLGTVNNNNTLTFTNNKGFSEFLIEGNASPAASIGSGDNITYYSTLRDALGEVKDGEIITLLRNNTENLPLAREVSFTVDPKGYTYKIKIAPGYKDSSNTTNIYTVTKDDPAYTITLPKASTVKNGKVETSVSSAKEGDTVIIYVTPDTGYTLETFSVTDSKGKAVSITALVDDSTYTFKMPKSDVKIALSFMEDNTILNYFIDISPKDFYYDSVLWAAQKGITTGIDELHFDPNGDCTRAQIVTFLWRAAGSPAAKKVASFSDVDANSYYAKAVAWAVEQGITEGTGGGKFSPNKVCDRAQAVTFLYRLKGSPAVSGSTSFRDVDTNAYYAKAVAWAYKNGVTDGTGYGYFSPYTECSRGQIVTFLYRAYK